MKQILPPLSAFPRPFRLLKGAWWGLFLLLSVLLAPAPAVMAQQKLKLPDTYNFKRGVEAYDSGEYGDAATYFGKEIADNPKNGYAHYYLAVSRANDGDEALADVLKEANLALKYLPKKEADFRCRTLCTRGLVQAQLGDTARALDDFAQGASADPENTAPLLCRADIHYEREEYALAEADYEEALRRDEACTQAYMGLGRNALERKDYVGAERDFTRVLRLDPSFSRAYSFRARSFFAQKKYREATADAIAALDGANHLDLQAYDVLSDLVDSAYVHVETQLRAKSLQDNTNSLWLSDLASVYEQTGHYHQALSTYAQYAAESPGNLSSVNLRMARVYMQLYDYPQALKYADLAFEADSTGAETAAFRGLIQYNLDHKAEALADMDRAVALAPDSPGGYISRGGVRKLYGDLRGALDDYNTALTLNGDDASSYMQRGRIYLLLGDSTAARRDFEAVLRLDTMPSEADNAVYALLALGDREKAFAWNDSILARTSLTERAGNLYNAACVYSLAGEQERALSYLQQSFEAGYRDVVHMGYDTDMDNLRDLPRYKELVDEYTALYRKEILKEEKTEAAPGEGYERVTTEVPFVKESGIYKVKCTLNGLPLHFYFDTGASDVTISSVEAAFMLKNGYLSRQDIGGKQYYGTASGELSEGTVINLRSVDFGGLTLRNVKASVVHSQAAPLLLGQTVLSRLGKIEIDYEKNVIKVTHLQKK